MPEMPAAYAEARHDPVDRYGQPERAAGVAGVADDAEQPELRIWRVRARPDLRPARQQREVQRGQVLFGEAALLGVRRLPHLVGGYRAFPFQVTAAGLVGRR